MQAWLFSVTCNEEDLCQPEDLEKATTEGQRRPRILVLTIATIFTVTHFECQYFMSTTRSSCQFMSIVERLAPKYDGILFDTILLVSASPALSPAWLIFGIVQKQPKEGPKQLKLAKIGRSEIYQQDSRRLHCSQPASCLYHQRHRKPMSLTQPRKSETYWQPQTSVEHTE